MKISPLIFQSCLSFVIISSPLSAALETQPPQQEASATDNVAEEINKEAALETKSEELKQVEIEKEVPSPYFPTPAPPIEAQDPDKFTAEMIKMFGTLAIFVTCMLLLSWMLKRMTQTKIDQLNTTSDIKILERRALSPKALVYVIEIHGKTLAVAESANGITKLAEFNDFHDYKETNDEV